MVNFEGQSGSRRYLGHRILQVLELFPLGSGFVSDPANPDLRELLLQPGCSANPKRERNGRKRRRPVVLRMCSPALSLGGCRVGDFSKAHLKNWCCEKNLMCSFQIVPKRITAQLICGLKSSTLIGTKICPTMARPSSDMADFRKFFAKAKHIVIISGAGVSAESGVPTFRGAGGYWRKWQAQDLATPQAFTRNPSQVWEFYHYRREVMQSKEPNPGHLAIAECEARLHKQGRRVMVITQNIDELHRKAGTKNLLEIHGSLFKTRCTSCGVVTENYKSPVCPALAGKGAPEPEAQDARIPVEKLPRCEEAGCGGLLRPHVVWFGENLDPTILEEVDRELSLCDLCLVVGTSSVVYPAAMFAPQVSARGVPVAEFNMETTPATNRFRFHFQGPCGTTLPEALAPHETETIS